jgi:hypothetical protein
MKRIQLLLAVFIVQINYSQNKEIINPKEKWFFGVEIGSNEITSYTLGENNQSFQGGLLAEYYFAKNWSLSAKVKYFETGVSFYEPAVPYSGGSFFNLFGSTGGSPEYTGRFEGAVIAIPISIKWGFRIRKNLRGNLALGYVYNLETKAKYCINPSLGSENYHSLMAGYGITYFVNENLAFYIDVESQTGTTKFSFKNSYYVKNNLLSFGVKFNFNKI